MKKDRPVSAEAIFELFRQAGLTSKIPVEIKPGERVFIHINDEGIETIKSEYKVPASKRNYPDEMIIKFINEYLQGDEIFKKGGRIIITRISKLIEKEIQDPDKEIIEQERGIRLRVKELLPYFEGVIRYNGKFYYKKHKDYSLHKRGN